VAHKQIFLSTVSAEFRSYRDALRHDLERPNVTVKVQEDFIATGTETLDKLDEYIRQCDAIIHLVGDMTGALAQPTAVAAILQHYPDLADRLPVLSSFLDAGAPALSYTQWEAWLALYHKKVLLIAIPQDGAKRDERYELDENQRTSQQEHLARLKLVGRYSEIQFVNADRLAVDILRSSLLDILYGDLQNIDVILERVAFAAREIVDAARSILQFSNTVVPVGLVIVPDDTKLPPIPTNLDVILERTSCGENLLLYGEGGIGKTTAAIGLARRMLDEKCPRIPVFMDAAAWSSTDLPLLDYIVSLPPFLSNAINLDNFARLIPAGRITLVVNGWNEIPSTNQERCAQRMKQVTGTSSNINVVLTARATFDKAGLVSPIKVRVTGLSWVHQKEFIRSQLEAERASVLIERLARNKALRVAARNPLVLTGVVRLQQRDIESAQCSFNIFRAIVENYESEGTRGTSLRAAPLGGMHIQYLEALACEMNRKQGATLTDEQARATLTKLMRRLIADDQITDPPNVQEVLQALCNHHLLFADGSLVRFAHQRFQEYFAASHLFTQLTNTTQPATPQNVLLVEAINWPFWEDALLLVAEILAEDGAWLSAKVTLIKAAQRVDLGIACTLAGVARLQRADNAALFDSIVNAVLQLSQSPAAEIAEYATTCMIDAGFDGFADYLWSLLESESQQVRLRSYQLGHTPISIRQLGPTANRRIKAWSAERRAEFVHEIAENPENADLLEELAERDENDEVKAAAIAAIAWDFPASEFALNAWMRAPDAVKLNNQVLSLLEESLLEAGEDVRTELIRLATNASDDKAKISLALLFPDWLGEVTSDALLRELGQAQQHGSNDTLVALVRRVAPEQFLAVAKELCLTKNSAPVWARDAILALPSQERSSLFEKAWNTFRTEVEPKFSTATIGACANWEQIHELVREWLPLVQQTRTAERCTDETRSRYNAVRNILASVSGDDLVSVALELGREAVCSESDELIELVSCRIGHEYENTRDDNPWLPTNSQMDSLIQVFWEKVDTLPPPQNGIHAKLCLVASRVDAARYSARILEGCRMELDAWSRFHEVLDKWLQDGRRDHRPSNPQYGNYVMLALVRCGFDVLPALLELIAHPHAHHLVFGAIARILAKPWNDKLPRPHCAPDVDGKEAKARRETELVMLQPDPTLQDATDQAARKLAVWLAADLQQVDADNATADSGGSPRQIKRPNVSLLMALATIPSRECIHPLWDALARDDIEEYTFINVLCSLVRQGVFIDDERVVQRMQYQWEKDASAIWLDQSAQYRFGQLNALFYFIRPIALLGNPLTDYLPKWIQICHIHNVMRSLQVLCNDAAWHTLVYLARDLSASTRIDEKFANAIAGGLTPSTFESFLELLKDGTFFRLHSSTWHMERMAGQVVDVIGTNVSWRDALIAACVDSDTEVADALACAVLAATKDGEQDMVTFGLRVLDNKSRKVGQHSAIKMLLDMFTLHEPLDNAGAYEVYPRACNALRQQLFVRALSNVQSANSAKTLLCEVEAKRREMGRPTDEPRHPDVELGLPWNEVLKNQ